MKEDVVILAGGFGKRLQAVISDVPKPMAPVNGKPFLHYLLSDLVRQEFKRIIISVGYKSEVIKDYFGNRFMDIPLVYVQENEPLGTGGGILNTLSEIHSDNFFVMNGDTYFDLQCKDVLNFHLQNKADVTLGLKFLDDTSRYGTVVCNEEGRITGFQEKKTGSGMGYINAGVYLFNKSLLEQSDLPKVCSIEKDFFEKKLSALRIFGKAVDGYFIDIGVPEDYQKANEDFKRFN